MKLKSSLLASFRPRVMRDLWCVVGRENVKCEQGIYLANMLSFTAKKGVSLLMSLSGKTCSLRPRPRKFLL